ncbi:MAG: type II secretion system secretin GspD [Betaproteobacteria bacterium]|nr:type II secretion system secretin GspD [Betaproteobacteria bacterium]
MSTKRVPLDSKPKRLPGRALPALLLALAGLLPPPAWAAPPRSEREATSQKPMTINLVNAEIASAVQAVAAATGRNFIVDPRVKGQITLQFEKPVSPQHVYLALLTQLRLAGYAVVEHEGVFKVVPEADARLQTTPVGVGNTLGAIPGRGDQVVTQIFQLRNQGANNLLPVLRPLISPNNTINVDPGSNALVITDYADNMKRLARIIAGLDVPTGSEVDVVPLRYAVASELAPTLQKLIDMQAGSTPGAPGAPAAVTSANGMRAVVLPESSSNALIIRAANGAQLMQIEQMVRKLDRPDDTDNIHVVYLHNANAADLARTLRGVLAATGGNLGSTSGGQSGRSARQTIGQNSAASSQQGMSSGSSATSPGLGQAPEFAQLQGSETVALPEGGSVHADTALNALIINAPQPVYQQLRGVIQQLDVRRAQVYVEALIAEVDANKAAQLGIQWQAIAGSAGNQNAIYGGSNFGTGGSNIINLQAGISAGGTAAGTAIANGTLSIPNGLNIGVLHNVAGLATLGLLANFLQTHDGANILSAPNLMTLDNEDAKIVVGQNVPFITGQYAQTGSTATVTPFQTVERKDVGLTLKVRPQITAGDTIKMDVYQEVSSIASTSNSAGIITNKRSIQTAVLVNDGQTIVLGGLMQDNVSENNSKIPGLGDIPGLGALFRSNSRQMQKTDLMVFLRPIIVRTEGEGNTISQRRYDSMQNLQTQSQLPWQLGMPDLPGPILPEITPLPGASAAPAAAGPMAGQSPATFQPATSQAPAQGQNVLRSVQASTRAGLVTVQLDFAQPLAAAPAGFTIDQPASIVLDFPGVVSGLGRNAVSLEQGDLRSAKVVEAQGRSRVILNLRSPAPYTTSIEGTQLLVQLGTPGASPSGVDPGAATQPQN